MWPEKFRFWPKSCLALQICSENGSSFGEYEISGDWGWGCSDTLRFR